MANARLTSHAMLVKLNTRISATTAILDAQSAQKMRTALLVMRVSLSLSSINKEIVSLTSPVINIKLNS